jgi:septal ring factor EnvC (AmiA/AmiB activator)
LAKEKTRNDFMTLQQMEQKDAQLETNLRMALNEIDQLKEENVRFCSQVRRLNKRIESSEREAKKALSALHKWGRVARNHSKIR